MPDTLDAPPSASADERQFRLGSQSETFTALANNGFYAWHLGGLRLELPTFPDRWDVVSSRKPEASRLDTSLVQKGSYSVGGDVWNRVGFQASQVDRTTGQRTSIVGDLVHQFPYSLDWDATGKGAPQALSLGFKQAGQWQSGAKWEYGFEYRALDQRFQQFADSDLKQNEAGVGTWAAWRFGWLRVRGFVRQTQDNLAEDPGKDRTTAQLGGADVELALPGSNWFTLSYALGMEERSRNFLSPAQRRRFAEIPRTSSSSLERMSATLYHWAENWDVFLSSSYSPSRDVDSPNQQTVSTSHSLGATFRPTEKLGFTPSVSFWQERQTWSGYQSDGATASLSLWYGPFLEGHTLTLWGSYDRGGSNDGYWDTESVNASAAVSRRLGRTVVGDAWLSVELGYTAYRDHVSSANSSAEMYGKVVLKLLNF